MTSALSSGRIVVIRQVAGASNATFLADVSDGERTVRAIYKPMRGERPLWDYPEGSLHRREVAAFEVASALGWPVVPETVLRDGPDGPGSLQAFVEAVPGQHFFTLRDRYPDAMRAFAVFDAVINNGDRKAGHLLLGSDGVVWGIDHGVSFGVEPNLRTVIWDFAGEVLPPDLARDLDRVRGDLGERLGGLLSREEVAATVSRIEELLDTEAMPMPGERRPYPWPLV